MCKVYVYKYMCAVSHNIYIESHLLENELYVSRKGHDITCNTELNESRNSSKLRCQPRLAALAENRSHRHTHTHTHPHTHIHTHTHVHTRTHARMNQSRNCNKRRHQQRPAWCGSGFTRQRPTQNRWHTYTPHIHTHTHVCVCVWCGSVFIQLHLYLQNGETGGVDTYWHTSHILSFGCQFLIFTQQGPTQQWPVWCGSFVLNSIFKFKMVKRKSWIISTQHGLSKCWLVGWIVFFWTKETLTVSHVWRRHICRVMSLVTFGFGRDITRFTLSHVSMCHASCVLTMHHVHWVMSLVTFGIWRDITRFTTSHVESCVMRHVCIDNASRVSSHATRDVRNSAGHDCFMTSYLDSFYDMTRDIRNSAGHDLLHSEFCGTWLVLWRHTITSITSSHVCMCNASCVLTMHHVHWVMSCDVIRRVMSRRILRDMTRFMTEFCGTWLVLWRNSAGHDSFYDDVIRRVICNASCVYRHCVICIESCYLWHADFCVTWLVFTQQRDMIRFYAAGPCDMVISCGVEFIFFGQGNVDHVTRVNASRGLSRVCQV